MSQHEPEAVVITGGTGGLGQAVSLRLAAAGYACHITSRNEAEQQELRDAAPPGAVMHFHEVDVTDETQVGAMFAGIEGTVQFHGLVHLVGGFEMGPVDGTTLHVWDRLMRINATSAFICCREAAARMKPRQSGRIVTVSARAVLEPPARMAAYLASKAAVLALTQSLARELKDEGITVNTILPSVIDTPANRRAMPGADPARWIPPGRIADAILLLLGPDAAGITGAALPL